MVGYRQRTAANSKCRPTPVVIVPDWAPLEHNVRSKWIVFRSACLPTHVLPYWVGQSSINLVWCLAHTATTFVSYTNHVPIRRMPAHFPSANSLHLVLYTAITTAHVNPTISQPTPRIFPSIVCNWSNRKKKGKTTVAEEENPSRPFRLYSFIYFERTAAFVAFWRAHIGCHRSQIHPQTIFD